MDDLEMTSKISFFATKIHFSGCSLKSLTFSHSLCLSGEVTGETFTLKEGYQ